MISLEMRARFGFGFGVMRAHDVGTPIELKKKYNVRILEQVFLKITGRKITEGL
jgi:hypothetical protein